MAPFVLYAASLDAMCRKIGDRACVTPAGLLYACAKALKAKDSLDSELFEKALTADEVEWSDSW
jgi:hypothetical protein